MARSYLRPGIRASELKDLQPGRIVLIDPTANDVVGALKKVQRRCRKNLLLPETVRAFATATLSAESPQGWLGDWACPPKFNYGIDATCLQIVRLLGGPTACYIERVHLEAGKATKPRVPAIGRRVRAPLDWLNAVTTVFWTHLSEEELQRQEEWAASELLQRHAASGAANARRARTLRRNQLNKLIQQREVRPVFTAELQGALREVADKLETEGTRRINWPDFKRRWVGICARYREELATLWDGQVLDVEDLRSAKIVSDLGLSLGVWLGAQRTFNVPQLVFRITCGSLHRRLAAGDAEEQRLSKQMKAIGSIESHPGTANTIGWLRVHIDDDNRLCFVDEVQSDAIEMLLREADGDSAIARELAKELRPWLFHGFSTVKRWADALEYRVGIHSRESAQAKPGMTESARKWNTYYQAIIKRYRLVETAIPGYPNSISANIRQG